MTHWRQKPKPKPARPFADILQERNERRTAAVIASLADMNATEEPETVTYSLLAERAGVPLQYIRWKYPSREKLLEIAVEGRGDAGRPS